MSVNLDNLLKPLTVAGIIALVTVAFRISIQMEGMRAEVTAVKVEMQNEIRRNRSVTCLLASKQGILVADCPPP